MNRINGPSVVDIKKTAGFVNRGLEWPTRGEVAYDEEYRVQESHYTTQNTTKGVVVCHNLYNFTED